MGEIYDILIWSQRDVKHLLEMKDCLRQSSEAEINSHLMRKLMVGFNTIASAVSSLDKPDPEYFIIILDVLLSIFKIKSNQERLSKHGNKFGNLTVKILRGIEKTNDFFSLFSKFLSLINLICGNVNICRLLPRPLFNIFINKNFDLAHFQKAINQFKIICKKCERNEILNFTKENINILKEFSMLTSRIGDIVIQMDIVELILLYVDNDTNLMNGFFTYANRGVSEILTQLDFSDAARDSRLLLNTLNEGLIFGKKIYSINCHKFSIGCSDFSPPTKTDGIWVDLNEDTKRITIFCDNLCSKTGNSDFFDLPLSHVRKIDVELSRVNGEKCYCIAMKILKMSKIFPFAKGSDFVCSALVCKNSSRSILDFVCQAEKLSDKIQKMQDRKKQSNFSLDAFLKMKCSREASDNEKSRKPKNFISTSPLLLITREDDDKTDFSFQASETESKETFLPGYDFRQGLFKNQKSQEDKIPSPSCEAKGGELIEKPEPFRFGGKFFDDSFFEINNSSGESCESSDGENQTGNCSRLFEGWQSSDEDDSFTFGNEKLHLNLPPESPEGNEPRGKFIFDEPEEPQVRKTSLLDPEGYSFRRWRSETTSERGNVWLKKLQKFENENSNNAKDIFQFSEEDSDGAYEEEKGEVEKFDFGNNKKCGRGNFENQSKEQKMTKNKSPGFSKGNSSWGRTTTDENENSIVIQSLNKKIKNLKLKNKKLNNKEKLTEIVRQILNEMNELINEFWKRESKKTFKYLKMAQESIEKLTEMENEWRMRRRKFEIFLNYQFIDESPSIDENDRVFNYSESGLEKTENNTNNKKKFLKGPEKKKIFFI